MNFVIEHSYLIPLLPLIGSVLAGFFGAKWLKGQSHWPIWIGVGISAVLSIVLFADMSIKSAHIAQPGTQDAIENSFRFSPDSITQTHKLFTWIEAGDFKADAGFYFDPLTAVMLCVVCGIGFLITVFAAGYMKGEAGYFRFFSYLGLFIFMMTCLVMGENLIMLYLGWEGVGLCSYLLIGYYYDKPAAREAAKKAFLVNRIGDFGFGIGIMLTWYVFGTTSYFGGENALGFMQMAADMTAAGIPAAKQALVPWIPFCLMLGAFGKSAQFPLHVWLPDAMEGPTPVSALIHAATMVTAGVYMIARCSVLFTMSEAALSTVAAIGAFTALFAATIAMRQFDLKKVFAYSTISQLGFMFAAVGLLAPVAGVFHLVTHAFFKALLFLSSGVVMHAMLGHLDMRKMSGLKQVLPKTRWLMLIGCLALAGFPLTSGFFSKDEILANASHMNGLVYAVLAVTSLLTAYYTFRLYFRVFEGPLLVPTTVATDSDADVEVATAPSGDSHHVASEMVTMETHQHGGAPAASSHAADHGAHGEHDHAHNHEPNIMIVPLVVLALGALLAGIALGPTHKLASFLSGSPSFRLGLFAAEQAAGASITAEHKEELAANFGLAEAHHGITPLLIGSAISLLGIGIAYVLHLKNRETSERLADSLRPAAQLLDAKYWVDEIYASLVVKPLRMIGSLFAGIDRFVIDGIVWLASFIPQLSGFTLKLGVQRGFLQGYAAVMLLGIAAILLFMFL